MQSDGEGGELAGDGRLIDVIPDADAKAGEEGRRGLGHGDHRAAVALGHGALDRGQQRGGNRTGVLHHGPALGKLGGDQPVIRLEDGDGLGGRVLLHVLEYARDAVGRELALVEAQLEELAGELLDLLGTAHG